MQTSFVDQRKRRRRAPRASLLAVLRALGAPVERPVDAVDALRDRRRQLAARLVDPVLVAWDGEAPPLPIRAGSEGPVRLTLHVEPGTEADDRAWDATVRDGAVTVPERLPWGRHRLRVEAGGETADVVVLSAPATAARVAAPGWGVFVPLHAVRSERNVGIGDLGDLDELAGWIAELGGSVVATLPFFACFPDEPSPYAPISRRFWDERVLDLRSVPAVAASADARTLLAGPEPARLGTGELVDHAAVAAFKRRVLSAALRDLGDRARGELRTFLAVRPEVEDYARFRAACERWGRDRRTWPAPAATGRLDDLAGELDPDAVAFHVAAQWLTERQLDEVAGRARRRGAGLYLDVPVGVHPDGYDVWREAHLFAPGVSVGAPPDAFFTRGQDWGFPPLHPERVREDGYRHPAAFLATAFAHAGVVRIDHVPGLHRQYWVPRGQPPDRGVYVRYPAEEWYALLTLASHRAGTVVVGEDLGTVPPAVRAEMRRRDLLRSYVLQLQVRPERTPPVAEPPAGSLAAPNTHDLPTFAAFWRGLDIDERRTLGLLDEEATVRERERRERARAVLLARLWAAGHLAVTDASGAADEATVLAACLRFLAASDADLVVVALEDLWGETRAQNVPGAADHPNWRRRATQPIEAIRRLPAVVDTLRQVHELRTAVVARRRAPRDASGGRS